MADRTGVGTWYKEIARYQEPDLKKAIWQLVNTFVPFGLILYAMYVTLRRGYAYGLTLALAVVAAGLLVRIFIFFHDCTHGSFFASRRANAILGYVCGILTFTPYEAWRHSHAIHHATVADLDRRGTGDVWTMTVREYRDASWFKRLSYRVFRHPLITFVLGPALSFLIFQRFPHKGMRKRDLYSVHLTNLGILALILLAGLTVGFRAYALIYLPVMAMAASMGVWLFYVQHQFEGVYWARHGEWDNMRAALQGSTYYKLPRVLQWFTGNIGLHHIHHLRPRIPNYNLQRCYDETPAVRQVKPLTFGSSLKAMWLDLWDERAQELISFRSLRRRARSG